MHVGPVRTEMLSDVLTTKLHPPPITTTLVAQWHGERDERCAGLSLDEQDSEPARFLVYLVGALQSGAPVGESVLQALDTESGAIGPAMASLANELDALDDRITLVLDDYREVDSPEIEATLEALVGRMPRALRLVVTSREDPPFPLSRRSRFRKNRTSLASSPPSPRATGSCSTTCWRR